MDHNVLKKRVNDFAHRCTKLSISLPKTVLGRHIQGQLIRCSTSASANYRATCLAQSKASFVAKISIVIEETDESAFWIEFAIDEKLINTNKVKQLLEEAYELTSIFVSSRKTAQNKS